MLRKGLVSFGQVSKQSRNQIQVFGSRAFSTAESEYDVVVVGGGPGGYVAAIKAAQLGLKTACVESRGSLGGTCLNVGCIPSKALLHSSHLYHESQHNFKKHGLDLEGEVKVNVKNMMKSKNKTVKQLTGGIEYLFKKNKVDYVKGFGKLIGANEVSVSLNEGGNQSLKTKNVLVATGSEPSPLPPAPVDNEVSRIIDSTGALDLTEIPEHLVVIGGGVIGLEMGSVYGRLGAKVTVVEFLDGICGEMDKELTKAFQGTLKKQGFEFQMSTKVVATEVTESGVKVTTEPSAGGEQSVFDASHVLVATGRRPFTEGLGLEDLGIAMDKMGRVEIDDQFRTNIPSIYAIGDCVPGPMLAHKAEEEGVAAVENMAGKHGHVNYGAIPGVVYTHPEVASVGMTEEEVKASGVAYSKGSFPFSANSRAKSSQDTEGMVKILAEKDTDKVLGVHIMGSNAGEMIAEATLAMEYGASSEDIARTCHPHPSLSEALKEAAMATYDKAVHF